MQLAGTDLRLLRVFAAVVKHRGFAAAQVELNISQSTISNHITALEQRLGMRLCQRGRSGFKLTDKGEQVHTAVGHLLRSLDDFATETSGLRREMVGQLRIGLVDALVTDPNCRLSDTFAAFNKRPHSVIFDIVQGIPQSLQVKVIGDELDLAIGSFPHHLPGLALHYLYGEEHSLYCAQSHPLFAEPDSAIDAAQVMRQQVAGRSYWRNSHRNNKVFTNTKATVHGIEHQLILILSGAYIGFLPNHAARPWLERGALRVLLPEQFGYHADFHLITKEGAKRSLVVETFLADLKATFSEGAGPIEE